MRAAAYVLAVATLTGCAGATPQAVPPVIAIPAAPLAGPVTSVALPAAPAAPSAPVATDQPPWVERVERTEKTHVVKQCQVSPFTFSSLMVVENRALDADRVSVRVVQDDEAATGVQAAPGLLGKGYLLVREGGAVKVQTASGGAVPDDEARRLGALAAAHLGWPGRDVAAQLPAQGSEVPALAAPLLAVAAVPLHGDQMPPQAKATVRFTGVHKGDDGDELAFDVQVSALAGDAGMCHRWEHFADLKGELRLRAKGGALLGLQLKGETHDTEAVCQSSNGNMGPPGAPHPCNRGDVSIEVRQPHAP